jgi:hypothetical protein
MMTNYGTLYKDIKDMFPMMCRRKERNSSKDYDVVEFETWNGHHKNS